MNTHSRCPAFALLVSMDHKILCSILIYLIATSKVQCEENISKQTFIYDKYGPLLGAWSTARS